MTRPTLDTVIRIVVEDALERHNGSNARVAEELGIGKATVTRYRQQWRALDQLILPLLAKEKGVFSDEIEVLLGRRTPAQMAAERGVCANTARKAVREAAWLLGRRPARWRRARRGELALAVRAPGEERAGDLDERPELPGRIGLPRK